MQWYLHWHLDWRMHLHLNCISVAYLFVPGLHPVQRPVVSAAHKRGDRTDRDQIPREWVWLLNLRRELLVHIFRRIGIPFRRKRLGPWSHRGIRICGTALDRERPSERSGTARCDAAGGTAEDELGHVEVGGVTLVVRELIAQFGCKFGGMNDGTMFG